ncbi:MAG: hypothetical protein C4320_06185, partial [Armatimonadota bacterium]
AASARTVAEAESVDILFRDGSDGLVLRASTAVPELTNRMKLGRGIGIVGHAVTTDAAVWVSRRASDHAHYTRYPGLDEWGTEAHAALPLRDAEGVTYGVLLFRHDSPWVFTPGLRRSLNEIANLVALAYKTFRAGFTSGTGSNRMGAVSEVSRTLTTSPYVEEILQLFVHLIADQFHYRVCTVRLLDESRQELVLRATQATAKAYQRKRAILIGESIAGRALSENRPIIVPDVQVEPEYVGHDLAQEQGLRSMICIPLTIQEKAVGVLSCYTGEIRNFLPDEIKGLQTLAQQAALAIENAKLQVRDTLMQEVHHRVKNNLQQVAALLRLQMKTDRYKTLEEAMNDVLTRILAISAVHDLLSREDLDHVGLRSIAEALVHHQQSSLILPDRNIRFSVRGEDVRLNMTQATQIALVINELIANAIEHGFKESRDGEIHVTIEEQAGEIYLWVSNSGDRLPPDFNPLTSESLGLQIVTNLTRALGGLFSISEVLGWTVSEVHFPRAGSE